MANIKSSKKAIKVIAKKTENNHELKARVKNLIKDTEKAILSGEKESASALFKDVQKYLDQAVSKGLIKNNTADRQKKRLSNKVDYMNKYIVSIFSFIIILVVLLNVDKITDKIINILYHTNSYSIYINNEYYKENNYSFVKNTKEFVPYGKQDLLNIIYTTINSKSDNFTFYCPKEYQNCINDINN